MKRDIVKVIGTKGCGSVIAEAFFILSGIHYEREEIDYSVPGSELDRLKALNPLGQVPTVVLTDGSILTETLAILLYADSINPQTGLVPKNQADLVKFWRWAVFLIAAIYPTFTYGDNPTKWVKDSKSGEQLRESTDRWREQLWLLVEAESKQPFFLGETFSAMDIYLCAMTHWRPRRLWFEKNCPRIGAIADRVDLFPKLTMLWENNF